MFTSKPWVAVLIFAFALAGCGGGGADGPPNPIDSDPEILATDPAPFEVNVVESREIHIDFSISLDPTASFEDFLDVVTPSGPLDGTWAYNESEQRLTFTAAQHLVIGSEHRVKVATGLRYDDGSVRTRDFEFEFDVRPPVFLAPEFFELRNDLAMRSNLAVHPNGLGMAMLVFELADGRNQVVARPRDVGGDFGSELSVTTGDAVNPGRVRVARNGNAVFAWRQGSHGLGTSSQRMTYYRRESNHWDASLFLEGDPDLSAQDSHVAIDGDGNAFFAWREKVHSTDEVRVAVRRYAANGSLEAVRHFSGDGVFGLHLAANARGDAVVAWSSIGAGGAADGFAARWNEVGGWSDPEPVESLPFGCNVTEVSVAPDGHALVLLACREGTGPLQRRMRIAPYTPQDQPNSGWKPTIPLHNDLGDNSDQYMDVAADGEFMIVYAWTMDAEGLGQVRGARYVASSGELSTELLSSPLALDIEGTSHGISLSPGGDVIVYWTEEQPGVHEDLRAAVWRRTEEPARDILVRRLTGADALGGLRVAAEPGGGGVVVWSESDPDLGGEPARRLGSVRIDADGHLGVTDFVNPTPGDRAENHHVKIDQMGRGALVWRHVDSATGEADIRYRPLR